jgi:hypothetical protein
MTEPADATSGSTTLARDLYTKVWTDSLKPFLDFKSYLWQRKEILRHPDLMFPSDILSSKDWKTPLSFAIQGLLVSILFR